MQQLPRADFDLQLGDRFFFFLFALTVHRTPRIVDPAHATTVIRSPSVYLAGIIFFLFFFFYKRLVCISSDNEPNEWISTRESERGFFFSPPIFTTSGKKALTAMEKRSRIIGAPALLAIEWRACFGE